jgi:hypothetical protein
VPPTPITAFPKEKLDRCGYLLAKQKAANAEPWREELSGLVAEIREHYKLLDAHVAPADQVSFVTQERTGTRDVTAVLIHAVEAKALKAA